MWRTGIVAVFLAASAAVGVLPARAQDQPKRPTIEQLLAACDETADLQDRNLKACTELGRRYVAGDGIAMDFEAAKKFLFPGCFSGSAEMVPRACHYLGMMREQGLGYPEGDPRSEVLFRKACEANYARSCVAIGANKRESLGAAGVYEWLDKACTISARGCYLATSVKMPTYKTRAYLEKACEGDLAIGCASLGALYETGKAGKGGADTAKARELYTRACELGEQRACTRALDLEAGG
ncbi:MAG: tetratricopeptide repeat protein [Erythrobacter sp.]|uniref:tetratricopeptide repeat protein n=1 Tax=Erythrobacter sp. TaxID=1042 RepID=UPI0032EC02F1